MKVEVGLELIRFTRIDKIRSVPSESKPRLTLSNNISTIYSFSSPRIYFSSVILFPSPIR